ncbi:MAG: CBS domain-containing protein, partial [Terriglobales bacterium]
VPLVSLVLAPGGTPLYTLAPEHVIFCQTDTKEKDVAEMFDKYNLLTLPVVDDQQHMTGIITADDVISLLRDKG